MKLYIKVGLLCAGVLALFSFVMSVVRVRELLEKVPADAGSVRAAYHFVLYLPPNRNSFYSGIIAGAQKAAAECNAALSIHPIDESGLELRMASYLGIDGIVVFPNLDDSVTVQKLEKLRQDAIPTVLINHNVPAEQPWPFIGTNNFDLGKKAGSLVNREASALINMAVIYSEKSPAIFAERELVEMGISGVLEKSLVYPIMRRKTDLNPRDAEKIVYQLVRSQPSLTTIVFTDSNDTVAGTQALIDLNLVGRVQIVGFGSDSSIREYVQKGIINGSLVVNPELIGFQAVKSLAELCLSGYTSNSVDIGIDIISREKK